MSRSEDDMDGFNHGGRDWSTRDPGDGSRILGVDPKLIYAGWFQDDFYEP